MVKRTEQVWYSVMSSPQGVEPGHMPETSLSYRAISLLAPLNVLEVHTPLLSKPLREVLGRFTWDLVLSKFRGGFTNQHLLLSFDEIYQNKLKPI